MVRGESVLVGGLQGCYWWKTVWRTRELHYYIQTENIKQLRVACSECTCTVGVVIIFYIESHWIHQNTWKAIVCCLFSGYGINAFRMASSNSSLAAKSCACAYIAFLAGFSPGMRTVIVCVITETPKGALCVSWEPKGKWMNEWMKAINFGNVWLKVWLTSVMREVSLACSRRHRYGSLLGCRPV
jgi:hypothetical protein